MIGRLSGTLAEKRPPTVLVDVAGVGYEVDVSMTTFYGLPGAGSPVRLYIHQVVREDAQLLFGFLTDEERQAFRQLLRITGVGARIALSLLSGMSVAELSQTVAQQDAARLVRIPGIGRKTAERLLLELKDKLSLTVAPPVESPAGRRADCLAALLALGYAEKEALAALGKVPAELPTADAIRQALRLLSKVL